MNKTIILTISMLLCSATPTMYSEFSVTEYDGINYPVVRDSKTLRAALKNNEMTINQEVIFIGPPYAEEDELVIMNPLHLAICLLDDELVTWLVDHNADLDVQDCYSRTPWRHACELTLTCEHEILKKILLRLLKACMPVSS